MSGQIRLIEDGWSYEMDNRTSVTVYRRPDAESGGYPFVACLCLVDERGAGNGEARAFGLFRLTKTDMRNIKSIINRLLTDREAE
ncbi:hypothetical protein EP30_05305 [Bifidobacterium sp. UTCIF-39]|uniref:hypothetical protein n=1 Tax=Bifidobacterium sp. UTCIF-39 TaxID=1465359 RepID=UPI0011288189|nr:hypothetical protein [Bifidobacterium sp. UTCIF-39]TPF96837.1 hypothetical protein EP30_05305 [Bifidobacterium sp. UTCIF-39]